MDTTILYLGYCELGIDEFIARARPALVLHFPAADPGDESADEGRALSLRAETDTTRATRGVRVADGSELQVHTLIKKPGSAFSEMITVGRTENNDICLPVSNVSRFHFYFRSVDREWFVCDAGSKNGTRLDHRFLPPRVETPIASGNVIQVGDVVARFYLPLELYEALLPLTVLGA